MPIDSDKMEFYRWIRSDGGVDPEKERAIRDTVDQILDYQREANTILFLYRRQMNALEGEFDEKGVRVISPEKNTNDPTELDFNDVSMMAYVTNMENSANGFWERLVSRKHPLERYEDMYCQLCEEHASGGDISYGFLPDVLTDHLNQVGSRDPPRMALKEYTRLMGASDGYIKRFDNLFRLSELAENIYQTQNQEKVENTYRMLFEGDCSSLAWKDDTFSKADLKYISDMCETQASINLLRSRLVNQALYRNVEAWMKELEQFYTELMESFSPFSCLRIPKRDLSDWCVRGGSSRRKGPSSVYEH